MSDGEGLAIDILPNGKKKWTLSYRVNGKQSRKHLGDYPEIGCKQARQLARDIKKQLTGKQNNNQPCKLSLMSGLSCNRPNGQVKNTTTPSFIGIFTAKRICNF